MKTKLIAAGAACVVWLSAPAVAQTGAPTAPQSEAQSELETLVARVKQKLRAGEASAAQLAPELAAFDALVAKYAEREPAAAANILELQWSLYRQVLDDDAKAAALLQRLVSGYAQYPAGVRAAMTLEREKRAAEARAVQAALVGQPAPEIAFLWSTETAWKKLSDLRGKVVVLDFWATWCGPCLATFPQIRELVEHYKDDPRVAIVGVTSLQGRVSNLQASPIDTRNDPQREFALMRDFIKAKSMTWPVVFSEEGVFNPAYGIEGIPHMTIIAPDGTVRHNDLHPGMPHAEKLAKIDAILKELGPAGAPAPRAEGK